MRAVRMASTNTPSSLSAAACFWRRWSAKQWILASLVGALVAIAVVAGTSISLAPAHISFSIAEVKMTNTTDERVIHQFYNFTLMVNNTSGRTSASYGHLKAAIWYGSTSWIPMDEVNTTAELPPWQPPRTGHSVALGTEVGQYSQSQTTSKGGGAGSPPAGAGCPGPAAAVVTSSDATTDSSWPNSRVVVEAKVRSRFGLATTVPYTLRVSCWPVNFVDKGTNYPIECRG